MEPISFVIRLAAVPVCWNDIVPPQGGSYTGAGTCITPTPISVTGRAGGRFQTCQLWHTTCSSETRAWGGASTASSRSMCTFRLERLTSDLQDMSLSPLCGGTLVHWLKWKDLWGQVFLQEQAYNKRVGGEWGSGPSWRRQNARRGCVQESQSAIFFFFA